MDAANKTYIINVEFPNGSSRKFKMSSWDTLETLHACILKETKFLDLSHLHVFYTGNKTWDPDNEILCMDGLTWDVTREKGDAEYQLSDLNLAPGTKFIYIFDISDAWKFQCTVEDIIDEQALGPVLIQSVGEPPEQHPEYDNFFQQIIQNPNYPELTFLCWRHHIGILQTFLDIDVVNVDHSLLVWSFIPQVPIQTRGVMTHRYSGFVLRYLIRKYRQNLSALKLDFLTHHMKTDMFLQTKEEKFPGMSDEEIINKFIASKNRLMEKYNKLMEVLKDELKSGKLDS